MNTCPSCKQGALVELNAGVILRCLLCGKDYPTVGCLDLQDMTHEELETVFLRLDTVRYESYFSHEQIMEWEELLAEIDRRRKA